jgi:hypothetical protein
MYHEGMDILLMFVFILGFSLVYLIFNILFGLSDDNYVVYYDREIRYEDPPF